MKTDERLTKRRQDAITFQTESSEVSFNDYREKMDDKRKTCYLQTVID